MGIEREQIEARRQEVEAAIASAEADVARLEAELSARESEIASLNGSLHECELWLGKFADGPQDDYPRLKPAAGS